MTYSDLYTTVTQYYTTFKRSSPACGKDGCENSGMVLVKPICETQFEVLNPMIILNPIS